MDLVTITFDDWWRNPENQQDFWRISGRGVAISLGETPRYIFSQILQLLKCRYHDRNVGYGNLLEGVRIDENEQVHLDYVKKDFLDCVNPNINPAKPFVSIKKDFLDFEKLVTEVEERISTVQGVKPAYSSRKFHELCRLLDKDKHYKTPDELRRFGFFMRNNPLFLDDTAKYLFFKKVLTIKEYDVRKFCTNVPLSSDIQDWSKDVRNTVLRNVRNHQPTTGSGNPTNQGGNPINQYTYAQRDGSIVFFRNCFGHVRFKNPAARYHDAKILLALEADLPKVIPVWFYDLVVHLDLKERSCISMCGYSWKKFLSKRPTAFN